MKDIAGLLAATVLALACLAGAAHTTKMVMDLKQSGVHVPATVVAMERGARNSKWAVYRYLTSNGEEITARDTFQQYIKRVKKGEAVTVIYDRENVRTVTADLGLWTWQGPAIFLAGFVVLSVLVIFFWRHRGT